MVQFYLIEGGTTALPRCVEAKHVLYQPVLSPRKLFRLNVLYVLKCICSTGALHLEKYCVERLVQPISRVVSPPAEDAPVKRL